MPAPITATSTSTFSVRRGHAVSACSSQSEWLRRGEAKLAEGSATAGSQTFTADESGFEKFQRYTWLGSHSQRCSTGQRGGAGWHTGDLRSRLWLVLDREPC